MDYKIPRATWVVIYDSVIVAFGSGNTPINLINSHTKVIDCQGMTLMPGFNDAHTHIFSTVSNILSVDCSSASVDSIKDLVIKLKDKAVSIGPDEWVKGSGYNEFNLIEKRHPNRWDIDKLISDNPVRLRHSSGHAVVLNSKALDIIGINATTPDPIYGVIDRVDETGEPTGLLLEMDDYLRPVIPYLSDDEFKLGINIFNNNCIELGITSVQDATAHNSLDQWQAFLDILGKGLIDPSINMMVGIDHIQEFLEMGLHFQSLVSRIKVGPAKIMATMTTGTLHPSLEELCEKIRYAESRGFQIALHGVEAEVNFQVTEAIGRCSDGESNNFRHRIEHCSECPPNLGDKLSKNGMVIVTQPAFIYYMGDRYRKNVEEYKQDWLYRIRSLYARGIVVGIGSDSPVIPMNPLMGIYAAATRLSSDGYVLNVDETVSVEQALNMYTLGSAYASFDEKKKGYIGVGAYADLILLDRDPTTIDASEIKDVKNVMTIIAGRIVWQG
jgi:hypothetical protein